MRVDGGTAGGRRRPRVLVGTCGFALARARIFRAFDLVEVQQTFYQPPRPETLRRWREEAPSPFRFTLKAWQLVTHPPSSPTYRRLREPLPTGWRRQAGGFRRNALTRMAWERTLEAAALLDATVILLQTPASFTPEPANLEALHRFLAEAPRDGRQLAFEPRGSAWTADLLRPLMAELKLIHAVDPFLARPVGRGLRYFRLHGLPAYHYRHRYSDQELETLAGLLNGAWPNLVLFNNAHMADDARRFRRLVRPG